MAEPRDSLERLVLQLETAGWIDAAKKVRAWMYVQGMPFYPADKSREG